jgi:hypothetical protein
MARRDVSMTPPPRDFAMTTPTLKIAAIGALLAGAALAAPAVAQDQTQCFDTSEIRDTVRVSPREITISTRDNRFFRVTTKNDCRSASFNDPLVFNTGGSSGRICRPVDATLSSGLKPNTPCLVESITPITKEQAEAARAHAKHH